MTAVYRTVALTVGAIVVAASTAACGGDSDGATPSAHGTSSGSPSPSVSPTPPPHVYASIPPKDAATAQRRLSALPGVARTRYDDGRERLWIYFTDDITPAQRRDIGKVLFEFIGPLGR